MDEATWKLLVDKAIHKTTTKSLLWAKTSEGPPNTISFKAEIDGSTTLKIWGYERNYSYELCLTRKTEGEPFEERKRVTIKKNAQGIDFAGLFKAAKSQISSGVWERAFAAVMEYLSSPTAITTEKETELYEDLNALGSRFFPYSQDERVLAQLKEITAAGTIKWEFSEVEEGEYFSADIGTNEAAGVLGISASLLAVRPSSDDDKIAYTVNLMNEEGFDLYIDISPRSKSARASWKIANEIYALVAKEVWNDEEEFKKIIRNDIVHDIMAALDGPDA